jgi:hypothetical protein
MQERADRRRIRSRVVLSERLEADHPDARIAGGSEDDDREEPTSLARS